MIEHLTDQPATVFGNSSGAIVALEVLTHYPERVQTVVAHEPRVVFLLPDVAEWLAFFDGIYDIYREDGIPKAMHQFASGTVGSVDHQVIEHALREHPNESTLSNARYWMEHELRKSPRVVLDLAAHARQLVPACGRDFNDQMTYQPNKVRSSGSWDSISSIYPADTSASCPLLLSLQRNSSTRSKTT